MIFVLCIVNSCEIIVHKKKKTEKRKMWIGFSWVQTYTKYYTLAYTLEPQKDEWKSKNCTK